MTKVLIFIVALSGICSAGAASAQETGDPGDLPEFFAGDWTVRGRETAFSEQCAWLTPNSYVVCNGADTDPKEPTKWVTLLGYSHARQTYNFSGFNGAGGKIYFSGWLRGDTWVFVSHFEEGTEIVRTQIKITPTKTGYLLLEETSRNGASWSVTNQEEHIRLGKTTP